MLREYQIGGAKSITVAAFIFFQLLNCLLSIQTLNHPVDTAFTLKLFALIVFPLLYLLLAFQWPVDIGKSLTTIKMDDKGIKVGFRQIKWDDLKSITHGLPFLKKYPLIYLCPQKEKAKFLTLNPTSANIPVPGYPFVYDEIIPYIQKHRPDVHIPASIPSKNSAVGMRKMIGGASTMLAALLQIAILLLTLESIKRGAFPQVQLYALLIFLPSLVASFICRDSREESKELSFLRGAVAGTGVSIPAATYTFYFFAPPAWTISALAFFCVLILTISIAAIALSQKWKVRQELFYASTLIAAIACVFLTYLPAPPMKDLSPVFSNESPLYMWSAKGRYIADSSATNKWTKRFLVDIADGNVIPLPSHQHGDVIRWFDSNIVIRTTRNNETSTSLLIYDVRLKKEIIIDTAPHIDVSELQPISKQGDLIWLTRDEAKKNAEIKVLDLSKTYDKTVVKLFTRLPGKYEWDHVDWSSDNEIIARGTLRSNKLNGNNFTIERFNTTTKELRITAFKHQASCWYPVGNFTHAFTTSQDKNTNGIITTSVSYVNLETGEVKNVEGRNLPSWIVDDKFAFRTLRKNGRKQFLRFDLRTSREKSICGIPLALLLAGVSFDGRYAFFIYDGLVSFAKFRVLDIQKKEWRDMETTGFAGFASANGTLALVNPKFSMWSPTTHSAVIETLECDIDKRLIKAKTKLWTHSTTPE